MDDKLFRRIFDRFDLPVLLKAEDGWLLNPAAQALCLSQADLEQLEQRTEDDALWLARQFYRVQTTRLDGQPLLMLSPDAFLSSAAGNVTSQLRSQLNSAFSTAAALSTRKALREETQARDELATLNRDLYRIFRMVTQLEHCTMPEALMCRMSRVDMVQWFQRLTGEIQELCRPARVKCAVECDVDTLFMAANRRQLDYMLLCLVSNSLKNVPGDDGRITLSMKRQQDQLILTVADNAGGFPPDYLVDPLWNAPHRLLPGRGLGLGFPLVQRIAAAHGGSLMAFPSEKGSRVAVSLPLSGDGEFFAQPELSVEDSPGFSLAKILLSDALPPAVYFPDPHGDNE